MVLRVTVGKDNSPKEAVVGSSALLTKSKKLVKFTDIQIGNPFYFEGEFWVRTSTYSGTNLASTGGRGRFGSCSFGADKSTEMVHAVELEVVDSTKNQGRSEFWFRRHLVAFFEDGEVTFNTDDSQGMASCNAPTWTSGEMALFTKWLNECMISGSVPGTIRL